MQRVHPTGREPTHTPQPEACAPGNACHTADGTHIATPIDPNSASDHIQDRE